MGRLVKTMFNWAGQLGLVVLITLAISILIIQTYDINDVSMEPTFDAQGNRVLVFLTPYLFGMQPGYGDIVIIDSRVDRVRTFTDRVLESPLIALFNDQKPEHMWVKRVIGLPGDNIESNMGQIYRNGEPLTEPYVKEKILSDFEAFQVPANHIFVMGDNRNRSSDSRQIGPVPLSNLQGKVIVRIFPLTKIKTY